MTPDSSQNVYSQILAHIGTNYSAWYAGIASNWEDRLFVDHSVPRQGCGYIARQCFTDADARAVEQALLKLGCDGGPSGGDRTTVYVYAYQKLRGTTNP